MSVFAVVTIDSGGLELSVVVDVVREVTGVWGRSRKRLKSF